jgi:hypothetical protein
MTQDEVRAELLRLSEKYKKAGYRIPERRVVSIIEVRPDDRAPRAAEDQRA